MVGEDEICIKVENALRKLNNRNQANVKNTSVYINDEGVKYDTTKRMVKSVDPPACKIPGDDEVFNGDGIPNYKFLMHHFKREGRLTECQLIRIIQMASDLMQKEPNLLSVDVPATVVGDIHGQFYDLIGMFELCGDPSETQYLFLGDYVDRGDRSIEVLILLYAIKINFPENIWLLRGNHESERMTSYFTYKKECLQRYSEKLYLYSIKSFMALPLCAVLNEQFFCVHAGISSSLWDLEEINKINRFNNDFPSKGLFCDLLWSDPSSEYDQEVIDEDDIGKYFSFNYERRCSEFYTYRAVESFLNHNNLLSIVRGHQPQDSGYRIYKVNETTNFPSLITLFSAPNYCGTYNNMAAVLVYNGESFNIKQFDSYPSAPFFLPNQMNLFEWSLPFVCEKVVEILSSVLNICTEDELNKNQIKLDENKIELIRDENINDDVEVDNKHNDENKAVIGDSLRNKILMVGRMSRLLKLLREETEKVEELKRFNNGKLPSFTLLDGRDELNNKLKNFQEVRAADIENEGLPPSTQEIEMEVQKREEKYQNCILKDD